MAETGYFGLDAAQERWGAVTAQLPLDFQVELLAALKAVEDEHLTLVFDARDGHKSQDRFDHPIAAAYDRIMFWEALALGYNPQPFKLIPVGGTILRRHFGDPNPDVAAADQGEREQLRQWLDFISSTDLPREDLETGGQISLAPTGKC